MKILIFYDGISFRLRNKKNTIRLINEVIRNNGLIPGDLNFIFTSDNNLLEINREFLKHNYYTDVIAFGGTDKGVVSGEIYISIDHVRNNAYNYKVSLEREVIRVVVHGVLHLCGFIDDFEDEKEEMHRLEEIWLKKYMDLK